MSGIADKFYKVSSFRRR